MELILYSNKADTRKLDKTSDLTLINTYPNCVLKDDTNIDTPIFKLKADIEYIDKCNYIYARELNHYYYVNNINYLNNNIFELECKKDVLMSNLDEIKELMGVVKRQEKNWNVYLNDDKYKCYNYTRTEVMHFPNGLTSNNYVLAIAGFEGGA